LSFWPKWDKNKIKEDEIKIPIQINGKVRSEIIISKEMSEEQIKKIALEDKDIVVWISGKEVKKFIYVPLRIVNIVI
jgi:leucyl-tRNA synthetase